MIGPLFLLQVIAAFGLAAAVLVSDSRLAAMADAGFALSTLSGYLLSVSIGLFGFKEIRTTAGIVAGVTEVAAFAALAMLALSPAAAHRPAGPWRPAAACWPGCRRACQVPGRRLAQCRLLPWCCWASPSPGRGNCLRLSFGCRSATSGGERSAGVKQQPDVGDTDQPCTVQAGYRHSANCPLPVSFPTGLRLPAT